MTDLKQTLKARAAVYGSALDPSWFCKGVDLSSKVKTLQDRRVARGMLIGAALFTVQMGAQKIRKLLSEGKAGVTDKI